MSRKPVDADVAERKGKSYGRQAMWEAMRERGEFTLKEIAVASGRDASSVGTYLKRLVAGGIVAETGTIAQAKTARTRRYQRKLFSLVRDIGHEAPRLSADGKPIIEARDQMWLTMKIISFFTYADLAAHASTDEYVVSPRDAADYCKHLLKAGYLAVIRKSTPTSKAVYKLLPTMNTGPHAPKVQRTKMVFDPNRQKIMWHEEIEP